MYATGYSKENTKAVKAIIKDTKDAIMAATTVADAEAAFVATYDKGYKKAFTTTKQSYKNTKCLKKGTRYYYKVIAYKVVDGKNVYSDWSNKAYRVAK